MHAGNDLIGGGGRGGADDLDTARFDTPDTALLQCGNHLPAARLNPQNGRLHIRGEAGERNDPLLSRLHQNAGGTGRIDESALAGDGHVDGGEHGARVAQQQQAGASNVGGTANDPGVAGRFGAGGDGETAESVRGGDLRLAAGHERRHRGAVLHGNGQEQRRLPTV